METCKGTLNTSILPRGACAPEAEWRMLTERGVMGGQGIFAASQPLDTNVKKYLQRYSV